MRGLKGKYAVVTGGAKGIGEAIAKRFLEEELAGVAILDFNIDLAKETALKLDCGQNRCIAVKCDVSSKEDVGNAINTVIEKFGRIDILVNNAGITRDAMFHKMTDDAWDTVINVNLKSVYYLSRAVYPLMREQKSGSIISISSTSAWGNIGQANYAASKSGILGFTKTLAMEGGKSNVRVNAIAPGFIRTDILNTVPDDLIKKFEENDVLLKRLGEPSEIASVAAFLASDDASFVTGQSISVSGGMLKL